MCLPCLLAVHYDASSVGAIVDYSPGVLVESECNDAVCLLCQRVCSAVLCGASSQHFSYCNALRGGGCFGSGSAISPF